MSSNPRQTAVERKWRRNTKHVASEGGSKRSAEPATVDSSLVAAQEDAPAAQASLKPETKGVEGVTIEPQKEH
jgi:hypothetical protein